MGESVGGREQWWPVVCASVFCGVLVVPFLAVVVDATAVISSMPAGASGATPPGLRPGFAFVWLVFGLSLVVAGPVLAVALYRDAQTLARSVWTPDARVFGGLGLLYPLSVLVAGYYLYRRYDRVGLGPFPVDEPVPRARVDAWRWWYGVAAGPVLFYAGFGALVVSSGDGLAFANRTTFAGGLFAGVVGLFLLSTTGYLLFAVGLTADLAVVRASEYDWTPGTRRYAVPSLLVPGLLPVVGLIYLFNRHRHVGAP